MQYEYFQHKINGSLVVGIYMPDGSLEISVPLTYDYAATTTAPEFAADYWRWVVLYEDQDIDQWQAVGQVINA